MSLESLKCFCCCSLTTYGTQTVHSGVPVLDLIWPSSSPSCHCFTNFMLCQSNKCSSDTRDNLGKSPEGNEGRICDQQHESDAFGIVTVPLTAVILCLFDSCSVSAMLLHARMTFFLLERYFIRPVCLMSNWAICEGFQRYVCPCQVNTSTVDGQTPLSEACARGHVTCVSLLLQHGANPSGTSQSSSPIHRAAAKGQKSLSTA